MEKIFLKLKKIENISATISDNDNEICNILFDLNIKLNNVLDESIKKINKLIIRNNGF